MSGSQSRPPVGKGGPAMSVDAPRAAASLPVEAAVPTDLLAGGELVILSLKPSLWTVLFESSQGLVAGALIVLLDWWFGNALSAAIRVPVLQVAVAVAALCVGLAVMQWVSRVYVLTNRRIMRIRGVFQADLFECPLVRIIGTQVTAGPHENILHLGSIRFNTGEIAGDGSWYHIARPHEVHAEIRKAIERAIDGHA